MVPSPAVADMVEAPLGPHSILVLTPSGVMPFERISPFGPTE